MPRYGMGSAVVVLPVSSVQGFHPSVFVAAVFGCRQEPRVGGWPRQITSVRWGRPRHQLLKIQRDAADEMNKYEKTKMTWAYVCLVVWGNI